jgi:hypothetical protein
MEEEDRSEVGSNNIASQAVLQNLELLTTTLRTYFRSEIAIVCADIGKLSAVVKLLLAAVKETTREMKDLKAQMTTISEQIDKLIEENGHSGRKSQCQRHSRYCLLHRHFRGQSGNGRGFKPRASPRNSGGILPPH